MKFTRAFSSVLLSIVLAFSALPALADSEFTVWTSEVFAAPYTDNIVAVSDAISNTNGFKNLDLVIRFEALSPEQSTGSASYSIFAVVEHEINGLWYPVATTWDKMNNMNDGPTRIIILGPNAPDFDGTDNLISSGHTIVAHQSFNQGTLGEKFRVKITVDNIGSFPLTSATLSVFGRRYDNI